jgi:hypothetical protein
MPSIPRSVWIRLKWPYIVLVFAMGIVIVDRHLPLRSSTEQVIRSEQFTSRYSDKRRHYNEYWSVVRFSSGAEFQTKRSVDNFPIGDTTDLRRTKALGYVVAYHSHRDRTGAWYFLEADAEEFKPFPYVVGLTSLLLLLPWRKDENRWVITGILGVTLVAWFFTQLATNLFRLFS